MPVVIANLDKIVSRPVAFVLAGKTHVIEPVPVEKHLAFSASLIKVGKVDEKTSIKDLQAQYFEMVSPICPSLTLKDVCAMTMQQLHGLTALIQKIITGEIHVENDSQKKNP